MGSLQGDVGVVGIASLFEALSIQKAEGFLSISQGTRTKVIHFTPSGFRMVSGTRRTNPLGEVLMQCGKITILKLHELLTEQRSTGQPLGRIAVDRGIISEGELEDALRKQVAEELYELFSWSEGTFEFAATGSGPAPPDEGPLATVTLNTSMMSVLFEGARRIDERMQIRTVIPDDSAVVERLDRPPAIDDPALDKGVIEKVVSLTDGVRSVDQIIKDSFYPRFAVLRTLYGLIKQGVLWIPDPGRSEMSVTPDRQRETPIEGRSIPGGRTVLLLSELATFRSALALCLRGAGFNVVESPATLDCLETVKDRQLDVIVLDISLQTGEGLPLCARLCEMKAAPLILLADNTSKEAVDNAVQSGARYVLLKPVEEEFLLERIRGLIKG